MKRETPLFTFGILGMTEMETCFLAFDSSSLIRSGSMISFMIPLVRTSVKRLNPGSLFSSSNAEFGRDLLLRLINIERFENNIYEKFLHMLME